MFLASAIIVIMANLMYSNVMYGCNYAVYKLKDTALFNMQINVDAASLKPQTFVI